ncbi:DUF2007 domain-containing protein [Tellurirhabdus rosea]|uniref:DUF2007 domain-containing protein n=1 Tax=Tellurirhabdus rosea TaxID=2674997 RepID=UPI00225B21BB|nr:DUF2007 domain-containing protein [Tellurirhabdus rosea]
MYKNWEKVMVTPVFHRAEMAKIVLAGHEIDAVVINKRDSNVHFGNCEVYVPTEHALIAKVILDNEISVR